MVLKLSPKISLILEAALYVAEFDVMFMFV